MSALTQLKPGQLYKVVKAFTDYDHVEHPVGEQWIFDGTNFLPYDDGLTVFIKKENDGHRVSFRMQWRPEEQGYVIDNFSDHVTEI